MPGPGFLDEKRREIESRMRDLRPQHEEYMQLERALKALTAITAASPNGKGKRGSKR